MGSCNKTVLPLWSGRHGSRRVLAVGGALTLSWAVASCYLIILNKKIKLNGARNVQGTLAEAVSVFTTLL